MKQKSMLDDECESGSVFSPCRRYRYVLGRKWSDRESTLIVIGLNPSTADETVDDPTIRRCIRFAKDWGHGGMVMLNLFAFRATDPKAMVLSDDPVGTSGDTPFDEIGRYGLFVVAAWGSLATRYRVRVQWQSRIARVLSLLNQPVHCLGWTQDRSPRHPLYVKADTKPQLFWTPHGGFLNKRTS